MSGPTARARLTQVFHNPTKGWVEGVYVYPLPEGAAVDTMTMVIGERIVVADIKERDEAKAIYEEAKAAGKKAALVEQQRPNIFTNSVANIGPGETVLVRIEYQEPVHQSGGRFSLRLPLVVAPRYSPARRWCRASTSAMARSAGRARATPCRTARRSRRRFSIRARAARQPRRRSGQAAGRLSPRRRQERLSRRQDRQPGAGQPHHHAGRGRGSG